MNMESLHERRETIALRFAKNCLKNENFSKLFPLNNQKHGMTVRNPLKYQIKKANTERLKVSTIPYMQRMLNDNDKKRKKDMMDLNNELNKSKTRKVENDSKYLQVNYVSKNDYHCRK